MSSIAREITQGSNSNKFNMLDNDDEDKDVANSSASASHVANTDTTTETPYRAKKAVSNIINSIDNTTQCVRHDLSFMQMDVLLSEVFSRWSSDWLSASRAFTDEDERIAFIAECNVQLMDTLVILQRTVTPSELMNYARDPLVITKNAKVPTESYMIHDVDFIKVFGALQFRLKIFIKTFHEPTTKVEIKKMKTLGSLLHRMGETKIQLYDSLSMMDSNRNTARDAFYLKKGERAKEKAVEKKSEAREEITRDIKVGWSKVTSKHSRHQQEIAEKQRKRADEKAKKAKAAVSAEK